MEQRFQRQLHCGKQNIIKAAATMTPSSSQQQPLHRGKQQIVNAAATMKPTKPSIQHSK
jgi:hypothetical protein